MWAVRRCVTGMVVPAIGLDAAIMEPDTKEPLFDMANIERATALKSRAFAYTDPHSSNPNVQAKGARHLEWQSQGAARCAEFTGI